MVMSSCNVVGVAMATTSGNGPDQRDSKSVWVSQPAAARASDKPFGQGIDDGGEFKLVGCEGLLKVKSPADAPQSDDGDF